MKEIKLKISEKLCSELIFESHIRSLGGVFLGTMDSFVYKIIHGIVTGQDECVLFMEGEQKKKGKKRSR